LTKDKKEGKKDQKGDKKKDKNVQATLATATNFKDLPISSNTLKGPSKSTIEPIF